MSGLLCLDRQVIFFFFFFWSVYRLKEKAEYHVQYFIVELKNVDLACLLYTLMLWSLDIIIVNFLISAPPCFKMLHFKRFFVRATVTHLVTWFLFYEKASRTLI